MPSSNRKSSKHALRQKLYALLGDLPPRGAPLRAKLIAEEPTEHYILERLVLEVPGRDGIPAVYCKPRAGKAPRPAVLYNHAHGGGSTIGKRELHQPRGGFQSPPYAEALAKKGIASLCIDQVNFGERHLGDELDLFKETLWRGQVLWGLMVYDNLRALDYLAAREDVDAGRIAALGLSMGSTMSWWTGALSEKIKVVVDLCCMTDYHELIRIQGLKGHGIYYFVPGLLKHFDEVAINELIVPRAHLSLNGNLDPLTPPAGLDRIDRELTKAYKAAGAPEKWKMFRRDANHFETAEMRAEVLAWLDRWL
ncbi:MAG: acetylxylan esterase [Planctomycetes bacterium]|nr:acetylxylan esterase [Planctomycetota bacterium]